LNQSVVSSSIFVLEVWEYGLKRLNGSIAELAIIFENHYAIMLNFDHSVYKFGFIEGIHLAEYLTNTNNESFDIMFLPKKMIDL
jgi:hypothetical protein